MADLSALFRGGRFRPAAFVSLPRRRTLLLVAAGLVAAGGLAGVAGGALLAGFLVAERGYFPADFLARVERKLSTTILPREAAAPLASGRIPSHLIALEMDVGFVGPREAETGRPLEENGGGLAAFGTDTLLLTYSGRVFAARSGGDIRPTEVYAPDNNRSAYESLAQDPALEGYDIRPGYLRYNDLVHVRTPSAHGLVASYTEFHPARRCTTNTLARLDFPPGTTSIDEVSASPSDWSILHRTSPCLPFKRMYAAVEGHMAGGRLAFEAPSTVYMTSGDFHIDGMRSPPGPGIAQDPKAEYGKILAVDIDTGAARIVSMGHRNPQGILQMPDGDLIVVEHGPNGGDEINVIREGVNYGWPLESFGVTYLSSGALPGSLSYGRHETFEPPIFSWVPSVAVSSIARVEGFHPSWDGDLIVSSLIDESLWRLRPQGERIVYAERIEIGSRLRDVAQHPDGRIVLWTDNSELIFLTGVDRADNMVLLDKFIEWRGLGGHDAQRLRQVVTQCAECHSFEPGDHARSPSLARVYGAPIASSDYDGYSAALRSVGGSWTSEALDAYISEPNRFAPGSTMPDPGVEDDAVRAALVDYLETINRTY